MGFLSSLCSTALDNCESATTGIDSSFAIAFKPCVISEITQGLKAIANELAIPVVALSQLSRAVEQRDDKKPQLSDLRESGSIEQDADVVMFVYREAYYLERKEPRPATVEHAEWQAKMNEVSNLAEIIIGKQRHGPTGNIMLEFEAMFTKFKDTQNS